MSRDTSTGQFPTGPIRCSFCGKEQGQVRKLVKGPTDIFICDECVAACDFDAIVADDQGLPLVVEDACNGCGKCVYVCPSNVYGSFGSRGDVARAVDVLAVNGGRS